MTDILKHFEHPFPYGEFSHNLFDDTEFALRFELGGEDVSTDRPLKRFIQAYDRATSVATEVFSDTGCLWMLSSVYGDAEPRKKRLKPFKLCGLKKNNFQYLGAVSQKGNPDFDEDDDEVFRHWDAAELEDLGQLREVIWLALGCELGIRPASFADIYFVDFKKGIVLYAYDDRGMDVSAVRKEDLMSLYRNRNPWLLEYGFDEMKAVFEG
ncbi:DUF3885 domain-containing protein [Parasedimentitalea maritima]|uniref:DUF3885 domain-containing protein n=1 Tax=Parasedimentitalea maritima TaxID=2578117 RepID=A0A6A4RF23_9RHOB|nr:DUF3885 domain-containing protein [Zongyanglinia marina]KAE9631690.1 DUF3885 domain-containing protein [Zongyanglinia marina]